MIKVEDILRAYRHGFFPMADSREGTVSWCQPYQRAVVPLDSFRPSRSLRRVIGKKRFTIKINSVFEQVIRACSQPRSTGQETWLSEEIIKVFLKLHRLGVAHSVESWQDGELAGGLYGLSMGGAFFGESMFFFRSDASKVAFAWLVGYLKRKGYLLLDAQIMNPHLESLGAIEIPHEEYMVQLERALGKKISFV
ncbi:MAG TPA: leucyl/phenylalanyl-tRNA--protein transferase [Chlorobaculum sp.]|uniref:Leucyl/phenylalanyl-tRNA--protein transferase n=1 Tax=Chlorobaculum tepidum (strain ATCC 49652 / DSM 12025 / NBRC 103806 / TLS) TaxID=194439 RepID=LFTR_CHLTE|nr:leucyl/phenylalanyl-tRNA--protein transferase [Chlorobaculum tepidum]Q8KFI0.1 RecName: Full=Leucyl/phenylalanyl-tRNA--protein transferase; AltName: Full=L/F-transferase; AltName: Full=Leucyltransferase; AltName: Full=Phenyalanyltransferase [Chlorobaculum tepidum TLS]AAM71592.1 leucyl/phenylalanyl-tRNA--protein transferase [Chlorobaculum tepidum TLS]HBU23819.1 leucyl/phenylalanyl-tRNA--protein transferase [Chlorobaculum sp.]